MEDNILSKDMRLKLLNKFKANSNISVSQSFDLQRKNFDKKSLDVASFPKYKELRIYEETAKKIGIMNSYFLVHDAISKNHTKINGKDYYNFASYDYLGLNGTSRVNNASYDAILRYGTSCGASRMASGEKQIHRELEGMLAKHYNKEDCICYVSGHATNVSTIATLFDKNDLILHDSLAHNSIVVGSVNSNAKRIAFAHNDMSNLRELLEKYRHKYYKCLIVTEGVFSMDGNICNLKELIELKKEFGAFLMVDEAHALGVLGKNGFGTFEHFNIDANEVDIWMGTLSKTLCSCGGYIAASKELVFILKCTSPSYVYSVGLSPALAGASIEALKCLYEEKDRVLKIQELSSYALHLAHELNLDTGHAKSSAIIPIIVKSSLLAGLLSTLLFQKGISALPIIYPVVEEQKARLRLFLSASHSKDDIKHVLYTIKDSIDDARKILQSKSNKSGLGNESDF